MLKLKTMLRLFLFCISLFVLGASLSGQGLSERPVIISIYDESIQFPDWDLQGGEWSPGLQIGTDFVFSANERHQFGTQVYVGGFYHQRVAAMPYLGGQFFYRFEAGSLRIQPQFGTGIGLHFFPKETYRSNGDGTFETRSSSGGRLKLLPTASLEVAYHLNKGSAKPVHLFARYDLMLHLNFADGVGPIPHTLTHVGVYYYPFGS